MIKLDKDKHVYIDENGNEIISVTTLLAKHNITPSYDNIDKELLDKARERGSVIHKEVEDWIKSNTQPISDEAIFVMTELFRVNDKLESEVIVESEKDKFAGSIDIVRHNSDGTVSLYDLKTGIFNSYAVSWQLTLYKRAYEEAFGVNVKALYCISCHYKTPFKIVCVEEQPKEEVDKLLDAEHNGILYEPSYTLPSEIDGSQLEIVQKIVDLKKAIKRYEQQYNNVLDAIEITMAKYGIKTATTLDGTLQFTRIPPTVRCTVDVKKLQIEQPEIYEKYTKETQVKASVRITEKENKDE